MGSIKRILRKVGIARNIRIISIKIYSVSPKVKEVNTDTITINIENREKSS
ncbi:MAG: hypothetical protein F6K17_21635 [Okeania sp. SIO3C4]|nr:hypothetical protein [Okeania sp. SIO3B3]NER05009.1 hypothetical protein [Okeania sp. SIO3C4]